MVQDHFESQRVGFGIRNTSTAGELFTVCCCLCAAVLISEMTGDASSKAQAPVVWVGRVRVVSGARSTG